MPRSHRREDAFTLVELLVVIGIIAVLISILLPALTRARRSAMQTVCASNLRQLAMAAYIYANDNRQWMVPTGKVAGGTETIDGVTGNLLVSWYYGIVLDYSGNSASSYDRGLLVKSLSRRGALECPETTSLNIPVPAGSVACDYGITTLSARRFNQIRKPTETPMFGDSIYVTPSSGALAHFDQIASPSLGANGLDCFHGRHPKNVGNLAFCDGHAESIPVRTLPAAAYESSVSIFARKSAIASHVGPCLPERFDLSAETSNAGYIANCKSQYDYYFWSDKDSKR